jgi:ABC-type transport system substrate-binding protein
VPDHRRLAGLVLVGVLLASVAAACTGGSSKPTASSSAPAGPDGGTLRLGIDRVPSLDPADASPGSQSQLLVADLLFDGLTTVPAGSDGPEPAIAASWKASDDQKTWTFTLRSGATFSNGRAITADDVKYSLERVAKQGEGTVPGIRLEVIAGYAELAAGTAPTIAGIKAVTPSSVEIDLVNPMSVLPTLLAAPSYGIVPKEAVEAASPVFKSAPVGSGPFSYAGSEGDVVKLVRASASSAHLDGIELHEYADVATSYADFTADKLDWSLVPAAKVDDAVTRYGSDAFRPFHAELFYAINVLDPTFADPRFRQAIVKAVDRTALVKALYAGVADPLGGVVPAGVPGHVDDPCGAPCAYNPDEARALLGQAFPAVQVPTVNIDYEDSPDNAAVAGAIEADLNLIGIPTVKRPHPADQYAQFAVSGQQGLFQFGWIGLYDDPDAYLAPLFASGSHDNATGFGNTAFDTAINQARATADATTRVALDRQAEQELLGLAPVVPIAQFRTRAVVSKKVHGLTVSVDGTFAADQVTIDH